MLNFSGKFSHKQTKIIDRSLQPLLREANWIPLKLCWVRPKSFMPSSVWFGMRLKPSCWLPTSTGCPSCSFSNFHLGVLDFCVWFFVFWCLGISSLTLNYYYHIVLLILSDKAYQFLKCTWRVCERFSGRWGAYCTILAGSFKY